MRKDKTSSAYAVMLTVVAVAAIIGVVAVVLPSIANPVSACTTRCWNDPADDHRSDSSYVADSHYQGNPP
jgi:hypothetical protein